MAEQKEQPAVGVPVGGYDPEELKSERERIVAERKKIIADLNKIKYPINAQVFTTGGTWSIRNTSFWEAMKGRDEEIIDFMHDYIKENK